MQRIFTPMEKMMFEMKAASLPNSPTGNIESHSTPSNINQGTIDDSVSDVDDLARLEENYHAAQIRSGQEIFHNGQVNNAVESQDLQAFLNSEGYSMNKDNDYETHASSLIEPMQEEDNRIEPEVKYDPMPDDLFQNLMRFSINDMFPNIGGNDE